MAGFSPPERRELQVLLAIFAVVTIWSAIRRYDMADDVLELVTPLGGAIPARRHGTLDSIGGIVSMLLLSGMHDRQLAQQT